MSLRLLSVSLLALAGLVGHVSAKPPGLPQQHQVNCSDQPAAAPVGQIIILGNIAIVGNEHTPHTRIMAHLPFVPGQMVTAEMIQLAEESLIQLGLFEYDPDGTGVAPKVQVLDPESPCPVKDILINVQEKCEGCGSCDEDDSPCVKKKSCGSCGEKATDCSKKKSCSSCGEDEADCCVKEKCSSCAECSKKKACCADKDKEKPKCECKEGCKCCDCQHSVTYTEAGDEFVVHEACTCKEDCKCCGCKTGDAKKETKAKFKVHCVIGCCAVVSGGCPIALIIEETCPMVRFARMCPKFEAKVKKSVKACLAKCFSKDCATEAKAAPKSGWWGTVKVQVKGCPVKVGQACEGWFGACCKKVEKVKVMPKEVEVLSVMPDPVCEDGAKVSCPFLKEKEAAKNQPVIPQVGMACTPLDNLEKLIEGRRLMDVADACVQRGQFEQAEMYYEAVMQMCPGSRCAVEADAAKQLAVATKELWDTLAPSEECEPCKKADPKPCERQAEVDDVPYWSVEEQEEASEDYKTKFADLLDQARCAMEAGNFADAQRLAQEAADLVRPDVAEAVQAGERAFAAGCYEEAWELVNRALMLHPSCMAAQELQSKLIQADASRNEKVIDPGCEDCVPSDSEENEADDYPPCWGLGFRHDLPPVNAQVAAVMEQVLLEMAKAHCFQGPDELFYLDSEECELEVLDDRQPDEEAYMAGVEQVMKQMADALKQWGTVEVDGSKSRTYGLRVWMQVGNVQYHMTQDAEGRTAIFVEVTGPADDDLRTLQDAHNAAIMKWIEDMTGGKSEGDSEEAEEEDLYQLETDLNPDW